MSNEFTAAGVKWRVAVVKVNLYFIKNAAFMFICLLIICLRNPFSYLSKSSSLLLRNHGAYEAVLTIMLSHEESQWNRYSYSFSCFPLFFLSSDTSIAFIVKLKYMYVLKLNCVSCSRFKVKSCCCAYL